MIELQYNHGCRNTYQFRPNNRCRIYGKFDLIERQDKYEIWSLGIFGDYRNKGYGTQMLTEFLQQFNNDKPLFLYVWKTNEIAIRLYQKVGFNIVANNNKGDGIYTMIYMSRT
jgi:ribosomal protein S18 acetylase RimI-like enzyme